MPHYAVILNGTTLAKSFTVRADRWERTDAAVVFYREDRQVHAVAAEHFGRVEVFDTHKAAEDHLAALRRRRGGARLHVVEALPPAPRQRAGAAPRATGLPAEGITFRIEES